MRCLILFQLFLSLILFSACQNLPEADPRASAPLPDITPFDANPIARTAYLDAYQAGYRSAVSGGPISRDFIRAPDQFARELGWRAGASAAQVQIEERDSEKPQQ